MEDWRQQYQNWQSARANGQQADHLLHDHFRHYEQQIRKVDDEFSKTFEQVCHNLQTFEPLTKIMAHLRIESENKLPNKDELAKCFPPIAVKETLALIKQRSSFLQTRSAGLEHAIPLFNSRFLDRESLRKTDCNLRFDSQEVLISKMRKYADEICDQIEEELVRRFGESTKPEIKQIVQDCETIFLFRFAAEHFRSNERVFNTFQRPLARNILMHQDRLRTREPIFYALVDMMKYIREREQPATICRRFLTRFSPTMQLFTDTTLPLSVGTERGSLVTLCRSVMVSLLGLNILLQDKHGVLRAAVSKALLETLRSKAKGVEDENWPESDDALWQGWLLIASSYCTASYISELRTSLRRFFTLFIEESVVQDMPLEQFAILNILRSRRYSTYKNVILDFHEPQERHILDKMIQDRLVRFYDRHIISAFLLFEALDPIWSDIEGAYRRERVWEHRRVFAGELYDFLNSIGRTSEQNGDNEMRSLMVAARITSPIALFNVYRWKIEEEKEEQTIQKELAIVDLDDVKKRQRFAEYFNERLRDLKLSAEQFPLTYVLALCHILVGDDREIYARYTPMLATTDEDYPEFVSAMELERYWLDCPSPFFFSSRNDSVQKDVSTSGGDGGQVISVELQVNDRFGAKFSNEDGYTPNSIHVRETLVATLRILQAGFRKVRKENRDLGGGARLVLAKHILPPRPEREGGMYISLRNGKYKEDGDVLLWLKSKESGVTIVPLALFLWAVKLIELHCLSKAFATGALGVEIRVYFPEILLGQEECLSWSSRSRWSNSEILGALEAVYENR